jgi:hypothetical protein
MGCRYLREVAASHLAGASMMTYFDQTEQKLDAIALRLETSLKRELQATIPQKKSGLQFVLEYFGVLTVLAAVVTAAIGVGTYMQAGKDASDKRFYELLPKLVAWTTVPNESFTLVAIQELRTNYGDSEHAFGASVALMLNALLRSPLDEIRYLAADSLANSISRLDDSVELKVLLDKWNELYDFNIKEDPELANRPAYKTDIQKVACAFRHSIEYLGLQRDVKGLDSGSCQ